MKQEKNLDIIEQQLLDLSKKYQVVIKEFENKIKSDSQIILLVGKPGCGKTTLFNFLAGAEFEIFENQYNEPNLNTKKMIDKQSIINEGVISITQELKYYFNNTFNHLLIDFSEFQDTCAIKQLMNQLLFQKISSKSPIKVVYVLRHPESSIPDRGVDFQKFKKKLFQENDLDSSKFIIILNSYDDTLSEAMLIQKFKDYLQTIQQHANENIIVIRKIKNNDSLETQFSDFKRNQLWQDLIKSNPIKINPKCLPSSKILSNYLSQSCKIIFENFQKLFKGYIELNETISIQKLKDFQPVFKNIQYILEKNTNFRIDQLQQFNQQCSQLQNCLGISEQNMILRSEFIELYTFFYQFSDLIEEFVQCEIQFIKLYSDCFQILKKTSEKLYKKENQQKLTCQREIIQIQGQENQKDEEKLKRQLDQIDEEICENRKKQYTRYLDYQSQKQQERQKNEIKLKITNQFKIRNNYKIKIQRLGIFFYSMNAKEFPNKVKKSKIEQDQF